MSLLIPGYLLSSLIFRNEKSVIFFHLPMSYALGSFFVTMQLFIWFFLLRLKFDLFWFALLLFFEIGLLGYYCYRKKVFGHKENLKKENQENNFKLFKIILILLIFIQILFSLFNALSRPTITFDSVAMWTLKAKILFNEQAVSFNPLNDFYYLGGGGHRNYPWHIPLSQFWLFEIMGENNDLYTNLIFWFYFVCLLAIFYFFLNKFTEPVIALAFTFILSSLPLVFYHSYNGYADLVLSFYIFICFYYFYQWLRERDYKNLVISAAFAGISFWVKDTGIVFILSIVGAMILFSFFNKIKFKEIFLFLGGLIIPIIFWVMFKALNDLGVSNVESGFGFHPEIWKNFLGALFLDSSWNLWWFVYFVLLFLFSRKIIRRKELIFSNSVILLYFIITACLYVFTARFAFVLDKTAISRNILAIIPCAVFMIGILYNHDENLIKL